MASNWFIEETLPDGSFKVLKRGLTEEQALDFMRTYPTTNRLEMWSDVLAASPKGFAPVAYKSKGKVLVSNTLSMLRNM